MRNYLRFILISIVFIGYSFSHAGSYDDFFVAIKRDDAATVQGLLQRGFDPNTPSPTGQRPLAMAIREPAPQVALTLARWPKTDVEVRNAQDESPLMFAALKGQDEIVAALIARGAHVNKTGWTPLHYAATGGHLMSMQRLLDAYAYIDAESPNGTTPLMMAAQYGTAQAVEMLLVNGADASIKNKLGMTAIDFARRAGRDDSVELITRAIRQKRPRGTW